MMVVGICAESAPGSVYHPPPCTQPSCTSSERRRCFATRRRAIRRQGPGDVLVELRAAALNRRDTYVRKGAHADAPLRASADPRLGRRGRAARHRRGGRDPAVAELGRIRLRVRNCVSDPRRARQRHLCRARQCSRGERLSKTCAPVLARDGGAAAGGLDSLSRALLPSSRPEGETVLILGVGSGVSTFAVSLAAQAGARVIVTSSSAEKLARATELGAEAGVNYREDGWIDEVLGRAGGTGVDVVVDSVGSTWPDSIACLRRGGRLVVFGATGSGEVTLDVRQVFSKQVSVLGTAMGSPRSSRLSSMR